MTDPTETAQNTKPSYTPEEEARARAIIETALEDGVARFYEIVRDDDLIGHIFSRTVHDLAGHKRTMVDFWSRMVLGTDRYNGMPLPPHVGLDLTRAHFVRWLDVWREAAFATMPEPLAELVVARATGMSAHWIEALDAVRAQQAGGKDESA